MRQISPRGGPLSPGPRMPPFSLRLSGSAATSVGNALAHELQRTCEFAAFEMPHPQDTSCNVVVTASTLDAAVGAAVGACDALVGRLDAMLLTLRAASPDASAADDADAGDACEARAAPGIVDAVVAPRQIARRSVV